MNFAELQHAPRRLMMGRRLLGGVVAFVLIALMAGREAPVAMQAAGDNPIVVENQQPGSNGWMWTTLGDDVARQIKGFASTTSVNLGGNITFYVTVNPAQTYTIDIYRIG